MKTISEAAAHSAMPEEIATKQFPFELAFAMTPFKLQSRSLPYLNINLPKRPLPPYMNFTAFYVQVSRGLRFDSLRWLQCDEDARDKLGDLQHDEYYVAWNEAYAAGPAGGVFRPERCELARRRHLVAIKRARAKARAAEDRAAARARAAQSRADAAKRKRAAGAEGAKKRRRAARVSQPSDAESESS